MKKLLLTMVLLLSATACYSAVKKTELPINYPTNLLLQDESILFLTCNDTVSFKGTMQDLLRGFLRDCLSVMPINRIETPDGKIYKHINKFFYYRKYKEIKRVLTDSNLRASASLNFTSLIAICDNNPTSMERIEKGKGDINTGANCKETNMKVLSYKNKNGEEIDISYLNYEYNLIHHKVNEVFKITPTQKVQREIARLKLEEPLNENERYSLHKFTSKLDFENDFHYFDQIESLGDVYMDKGSGVLNSWTLF